MLILGKLLPNTQSIYFDSRDSNITTCLYILLTAPVTLSHSIVRPVNIAMELHHVVTIPQPKQQDHDVLPHQPHEDDLAAELLGASYQGNVDHQAGH